MSKLTIKLIKSLVEDLCNGDLNLKSRDAITVEALTKALATTKRKGQ